MSVHARERVYVCELPKHKHTTFFNQDIFGIELGKRYNENNIRGPGVKSSRETSPVVPLLETQTKISLFLSVSEFNRVQFHFHLLFPILSFSLSSGCPLLIAIDLI